MGGKRRILVCDDEPHILRAAEFKFRRAGYEVICASDGQEAWEYLSEDPPDAVITDCQMPRMNGLELAHRIKGDARTQHVPIVMLTAKGLELSREELREQYHVVDVLSKPFSPRKLLERIEGLLDEVEASLHESLQ